MFNIINAKQTINHTTHNTITPTKIKKQHNKQQQTTTKK